MYYVMSPFNIYYVNCKIYYSVIYRTFLPRYILSGGLFLLWSMTYVFSQWRKWSVNDWCVWGLACLCSVNDEMQEVYCIMAAKNFVFQMANITMKEQSMTVISRWLMCMRFSLLWSMTYVFSQWRKWSVDDWCVWGSCYGQWLMCLRFLLRSMTEVGHWRFAWG